MNPNALLEEWHIGIRISVVAHYGAAKMYEGYHRRLGWPLVVVSAIAGTAVVASMNDSQETWQKLMSVGLSMTVTVLASLQTFLRYSELAEKHKVTATELNNLRRQVEQTLAFVPAPGAVAKNDMDAIRAKWDELSKNAPPIPSKLYNQSQKYVYANPPAANVGSAGGGGNASAKTNATNQTKANE